MVFARHETFYIRDGWLRKGLKLVNNRGFDFLKDKDAPEELGIGKNMVSSLRFWLQATNMVEKQERDSEFHASDFAEKITQYDQYFEDEGTLWLIHYNLVTNKEYATTWYWFFNIFNHKEFDEETFLHWLRNYTITEGLKIAESSLKKDFNCFINTYLVESSRKKYISPEDNINCPLRELRLLKKTDSNTYRLNSINRNSLDPLIVFYAIKKWQVENDKPLSITISNILEEECNAGKVFNLSYEDVIYYLEKLQKMKMLTVSRTSGLDAVTLEDIELEKVIDEYYREKSELR
ncbi:MAG: hypothetical protein PWP71_2151 [Clostridia bacterium]|jgi:hypothetical protein|nr:hypothetical protein [Clostridia bacterium]